MTSTTNVRHLYRSLLRECTYLPIPRARSYIKSYVNDCFRRYIPRHSQPTGLKRKISSAKPSRWNGEVTLPEAKQTQLLARGRKFLSVLHRANEGYMRPLEKVLKMTYGRTGKRRRQMMANLMAPETKQDQLSTDLEDSLFPPLSQSVSKPSPQALTAYIPKTYYPGWHPPSIFQSLLRSQSVEQPFLEYHKGKIQTKPSLPEKTIWLKPLPTCRAKNLTRKWYAKQAALLMPPLPHTEWEEIKSLATKTTIQNATPPRRRKMTQSEQATGAESLQAILLNGAPKSPTFARFRYGRPHKMTNRFLRRRMSKLLRHVPVVEVVPSADLENVVDAIGESEYDDRSKRGNVSQNTTESNIPRVGKAGGSTVFRWEQVKSRQLNVVIPTRTQAVALFGE